MSRFLMVADFDPTGLSTVRESIYCWLELRGIQVEVLNLRGQGKDKSIPADFALGQYSGVIVHNTISYDPENLFSLGLHHPKFRAPGFRKILLKQDEHYKSAVTDRAIVEVGFDTVFTITKAQLRPMFYPQALGQGVKFVECLPGYVSSSLMNVAPLPMAKRVLDLVYRGSIQPESFGKLANDKLSIAEEAVKGLAGSDLRIDISADWNDRIMGDGWFQFLGRSKGTLGVESGASILDPHGRVWLTAALLRRLLRGEALRNCRLGLLSWLEQPGVYTSISPRHFEASACGTVQFMYPGDFSGLLVPEQHYIPIERSSDSWAQIQEVIKDFDRLQKVADRARNDLIMSGRYSYDSFMKMAEREAFLN